MKIKYFIYYLFLTVVISLQAQQATEKQKLNNSNTIEQLLNEAVHLMYDDIALALQKTENAAALLSENATKSDSAAVTYRFAIIHYITGDYNKSQQDFFEANRLYDELNDINGIASCLNGKGLIQMGIRNFDEAIKYFEEAKKLYLSIKNEEVISKIYFNIGIAQLEIHSVDEAYDNFHKSLKLTQKYNKTKSEHMTLNRLADVHLVKNNVDSSYFYLSKLMNHPVPASNWEYPFAHLQLSKLASLSKNYDLAEENALASITYAQKINAKWDLSKANEQLYKIYKAKNQNAKALYYLELYDQYKDTLYNENQLKKLAFLQLQNKEAENKKLVYENELNQEKLKISRLISFFIALVLISFTLIIVQLMRNIKLKDRYNKNLNQKNHAIENQSLLIQNQNKSLVELNDHKLKLLSVLSHDMKGPLSLTLQILKMSNEGFLTESERNDLLIKLESQASKTLEMLEGILEWAKNNLENPKIEAVNVSLSALMKESVLNFQHALESKSINISWELTKKDDAIIADISHIKIVLHNLISNAIKYSPKNGKIILKITDETPYIKMHIIDFGVGISDEKLKLLLQTDKKLISTKGTENETGTGLGILLAKQFLTLNNAYLEINNKRAQGTEFIVYWQKSIT